MRLAVGILTVMAVSASYAATDAGYVFNVADFGAVGDGRHDDGPAIREALAEAMAAGPGATVVLEGKTHRLEPYADHSYQFPLRGAEGITIECNGALFLNSPTNGLFDLSGCTDVVVRNCRVDYDPLPFAQGTIRAVDAEEGTFVLELHEGYPTPPPDETVKDLYGAGGWQWGTVIDPIERHRRWDVPMHFFIDTVTPAHDGGRTYQVRVVEAAAPGLRPVQPGDRFFLPLRFSAHPDGRGSVGSNFSITGSRDCLVEDVTFYSGRSGMVFSVGRNEGRVTLRQIGISFRPGTDRVCTTWRDGMHCKDNRIGPIIEHCYFEGMLDDSINLGANTAMARDVISDTEFRLVGPPFYKGDEVMVIDLTSGKMLAETTVKEVRGDGRDSVVVLEDPAPGVVTGTKTPHENNKSTHFYNMSYISRDYVIRDCTFKPQRRHAMLVRAPGGLIEHNTIDSVGGSAVWLGNEFGSFYEGPFPTGTTIRGNFIRNTQLPAIHIYTNSLDGEAKLTRDVRVIDNVIKVLPEHEAILVRNAQDVVLRNNRITTSDGKPLGEEAVVVRNAENVVVE